MAKYKLRLSIKVVVSTWKDIDVVRTFTWDNKEDALACQKLLQSAEQGGRMEIEFVEFVEEKPLRDK